METKSKIRPEIFDNATDIIARRGLYFTCRALEYAECNQDEKLLWYKMHKAPRMNVWFGLTKPENQILREQCLREVRLNMEAQGFL